MKPLTRGMTVGKFLHLAKALFPFVKGHTNHHLKWLQRRHRQGFGVRSRECLPVLQYRFHGLHPVRVHGAEPVGKGDGFLQPCHGLLAAEVHKC